MVVTVTTTKKTLHQTGLSEQSLLAHTTKWSRTILPSGPQMQFFIENLENTAQLQKQRQIPCYLAA